MAKSLYICYFGVKEPLVQTQVIPYLTEIARGGTDVSLLTFEPAPSSPGKFTAVKAELDAKGIRWHWLRYHKRPSAIATAYDIVRGAWFVRYLIKREKIDILHGRVHVPTLVGALGRKLSGRRPKLLFDIRGFFPEEYTDAGVWPADGWLYRSAKRVERWLLKESDGFVVLTEKAREILFPESKESGFDKLGRPVEVIPCCVDLNVFRLAECDERDELKRRFGFANRTVVAHVGALGGLYLCEEMADLLEAARSRDPSIYALFLTQSDPRLIVPLLEERGFQKGDYFVGRVESNEVTKYLNASDIALSFVKAGYSTASRSPTKIAEYLACGLPIVANSGVGDIDTLIRTENVGTLLSGFSEPELLEAIETIKKSGPPDRKRYRDVAKRIFDLVVVGGEKYKRVYGRILGTEQN